MMLNKTERAIVANAVNKTFPVRPTEAETQMAETGLADYRKACIRYGGGRAARRRGGFTMGQVKGWEAIVQKNRWIKFNEVTTVPQPGPVSDTAMSGQ